MRARMTMAGLIKIRLSAPTEIQQPPFRVGLPEIRRGGGVRALTPGPARSCVISQNPISSAARCCKRWAPVRSTSCSRTCRAEVRLNRPLDIPPGKSEYEIVDYFRARGDECA